MKIKKTFVIALCLLISFGSFAQQRSKCLKEKKTYQANIKISRKKTSKLNKRTWTTFKQQKMRYNTITISIASSRGSLDSIIAFTRSIKKISADYKEAITTSLSVAKEELGKALSISLQRGILNKDLKNISGFIKTTEALIGDALALCKPSEVLGESDPPKKDNGDKYAHLNLLIKPLENVKTELKKILKNITA